MEVVKNLNEWVRQAAVTLLGELKDTRATAALLAATRDPKPDVALAAVGALEELMPPEPHK